MPVNLKRLVRKNLLRCICDNGLSKFKASQITFYNLAPGILEIFDSLDLLRQEEGLPSKNDLLTLKKYLCRYESVLCKFKLDSNDLYYLELYLQDSIYTRSVEMFGVEAYHLMDKYKYKGFKDKRFPKRY